MQTVDKAVQLLNLFTIQHPEIGLSELARLSGFDKAATRRFLVALQKHGFIEQNPSTKAYRLGVGFLHLARVREAMFPLKTVVKQSLEQLTAQTHETAHAAVINGQQLSTLALNFPTRANRVHLEVAEQLPLHATASGLAFMAFASGDWQALLPDTLNIYTAATVTDRKVIAQQVAEVAKLGYGMTINGYEDEVTGIAVPFFDTNGWAMGTLAVATPSSRMTPELAALIQKALFTASMAVTTALGGRIPAHYQGLIDHHPA